MTRAAAQDVESVVCLTADVHNTSYRSWEQRFLKGDEVSAMERYLEIAYGYGVRASMFIAGKIAAEQPATVRALHQRYDCEFGGHWFDAFPWMLPSQVAGKLLGLKRGTRGMQLRDVRATISSIEAATGARVVSWRDHAYRFDRNTVGILEACGIRALSNRKDPSALRPERTERMFSFPMNLPVDHDSIQHLPPRPRRRHHAGVLNTSDVWLGQVMERLPAIIEAGGVATLLVHPACMRIIDDFATFDRLCRFLSQFRCVTFREVIEAHDRGH